MQIRLPIPTTPYESALNTQLNQYLTDIYNKLAQQQGDKWNSYHPVMGKYHLWIDATGDLRMKASQPTSDTDGQVIGVQS
jgi:hypothetical protein